MLAQLTRAYVRRKRWEARVLIATLGEALAKGKEPREVSTGEMFRRMGVKV
jgi:hypothetical protein